jgi:hypothetical protein
MEWQTALHENVAQSQQALRKLLAGRLVFTPDPDGGYTFTAEGRLDAVVAGRLARASYFSGVPDGIREPVLLSSDRVGHETEFRTGRRN